MKAVSALQSCSLCSRRNMCIIRPRSVASIIKGTAFEEALPLVWLLQHALLDLRRMPRVPQMLPDLGS
jgi:hypothetical protein